MQTELIAVSFRVEDIPPLPNTTKGAHWTKLHKIKQEWTNKVKYLAINAKSKESLKGLYDHADIHFHISVGSKRRIDPDNLLAAILKPSLDGIQGVFIRDDTIDDVKLSFSFDREKPKGFTITITGR